jgi:hypothetical protein
MTKDVTLREMVEAMSAYADDETFRWYSTADVTLRISMGQIREVLGMKSEQKAIADHEV